MFTFYDYVEDWTVKKDAGKELVSDDEVELMNKMAQKDAWRQEKINYFYLLQIYSLLLFSNFHSHMPLSFATTIC